MIREEPTVTATKRFTFEAAHFLEGYEGLCAAIHGHSYKLEVTVKTPILQLDGQELGMVMDLARLKALVQPVIDTLDHSLLAEDGGFVEEWQNDKPWSKRILVLGFRPTTELLALWLFRKIGGVMPEGIWLKHVRLCETETQWVDVEE